MKKIVTLSFVLLVFANCKNKEQQAETSNSNPKEVTQEIVAAKLEIGCYVYDDEKNNITLEVTENKTPISGNLSYSLSEKDKNTGSFIGEIKADLLIATYTFNSEGKTSTRQVAFKLENDKLIEGYGELNTNGTTFKDVSSLNFDSKMPLLKSDCDNQKKNTSLKAEVPIQK